MRTIEDVLQRLRAEYLEMPGMRLKTDQVQRLCGIEQNICQMVLETLVDARFLCVTPDGHYTRVTDQQLRIRPAKADLRTDTRSQRAS
jgi:hypothetical protein